MKQFEIFFKFAFQTITTMIAKARKTCDRVFSEMRNLTVIFLRFSTCSPLLHLLNNTG